MNVMPSGPSSARIMIVGEYPGEHEIKNNAPFCGSSGMEFTRMLTEAGISREECFLTNVVRQRPPQNDIENWIPTKKSARTPDMLEVRGKHVKPVVAEGMELLRKEIELVRPNVIIACGNIGLWALSGNSGITSWRGSVLSESLSAIDTEPAKVVPIYSPSAVCRMWAWRAITVADLRKAKAQADSRAKLVLGYKFVIRPTFDIALTHLHMLQQLVSERPFKLAVDIETRAGHIACIGFAWSKKEAICIPLMCVENKGGYWTPQEEAKLVYEIYRLLSHPNCLCVGQNWLYDTQYIFRHWHFIPTFARDTMLAHHTAFPGTPKGLDYLSSKYCENHVYWKDEGKEWDPKVGENQLWEYNCKDCVITYEVDEAVVHTINELQLNEPHDFQQSMFHPVLEMMLRGVRVDRKIRAEFAITLQDEIARRQKYFLDVLGHPLNPASPKQMQTLFYGDFRQKPVINRKTGGITTDDAALDTIAQREPLLRPLIQRIREYRSLGVFLSTFVSAPLDNDYRMRSSFNIAGTETFRFSSSTNAFGTGLNLQNIPKGGNMVDAGAGEIQLELPNIRTIFVPDPGYEFFDIDLGSADLRIVAWEADEKYIKWLFEQELDPYTEIAKEYYQDKSLTKKSPKRQVFKAFAHATNYLGKPPTIARNCGLLVHEVDKTQKWYFGRCPAIKPWQDRLVNQLNTTSTVTNAFGYRRIYFDRIEGNLYNQAVAWIPQSTVGIVINRAFRNIHRNLREVQVLLQVHDSLAGQFPTHLGDWARKRILEESKIVIPYPDPLIIPVGIKTSKVSWGHCD